MWDPGSRWFSWDSSIQLLYKVLPCRFFFLGGVGGGALYVPVSQHLGTSSSSSHVSVRQLTRHTRPSSSHSVERNAVCAAASANFLSVSYDEQGVCERACTCTCPRSVTETPIVMNDVFRPMRRELMLLLHG